MDSSSELNTRSEYLIAEQKYLRAKKALEAREKQDFELQSDIDEIQRKADSLKERGMAAEAAIVGDAADDLQRLCDKRTCETIDEQNAVRAQESRLEAAARMKGLNIEDFESVPSMKDLLSDK